MNKSKTTLYVEALLRKTKSMQPGETLKVGESQNPARFVDAVKFIITAQLDQLEFSNDYKLVKKMEDPEKWKLKQKSTTKQ